MAALPTVRKSWLAPSTESPRLFFLGSTNCAITVLTLTKLTTAGVFFPGCILVTDLIVGLLIVSDVGPRVRGELRRTQTEDGVTMATTARTDTRREEDARPGPARGDAPRRDGDAERTAGRLRPGRSTDVAGRVPPSDLLSLRYSRMLANPLSFYRGNALLMAEDLARGASTSLEVQICGDAHLANFNLFSSPERHMVFDVNDFDETDLGPFEWDLKRLVASLAIASSHLGHSDAQQERIALAAAQEYRMAIRRFAGEDRLALWYAALDIDAVMADLGGFFTVNAIHKVDHVVAYASGRDTRKAYAKLIVDGKDGPRIVAKPPLLVPLRELHETGYLKTGDLERLIAGYANTLTSDRQDLLSQFTPVDAARKVVGVGSVGTECYVVLLLGRDEFDPFFLQVKQAGPSVIATARSRESTMPAGERVVQGQRLMQATPDVFLGWHAVKKGALTRHYYVRQLYDNKAAIAIEQLDESLLVAYGRICAWTLARAHARAGAAPRSRATSASPTWPTRPSPPSRSPTATER